MRAVFLLSAALACNGCVDLVGAHVDSRYKVTEREQKHFQTSAKPEVDLSTFDGAIEIRPWDRSEVDVIVEKRGSSKESLDDLIVDASQDGNRVSVQVKSKRQHLGGWHFGPSPNAKLIVSVPASAEIEARSGDGSIDIERVKGRVRLSSGDGSIRARELDGDVDVHTGDGSITLDGAFAGLKASTGDGSVRITALRGTGNAGDWTVTTGDGSITLEIPNAFDAELDAHTGDGRVHLEDVEVARVSEMRRNELKGRIGAGGRVLKLRTGDGSITIRRS